jgi:hypothetical protein
MNNMNDVLGSLGFQPSASSERRQSNRSLPFGGGSRGGGRNDIIPKGYRGGSLQKYTPETMDLFNSLFGQLSPDSDLYKMASGDESYFNEMEAPAWRDFSGALGGLANRFSIGSGGRSTGTMKSSGFQNTGTAAASNFAQDLASKRQGLTRQALQDLFQMSHMLFNDQPYERILAGKEQKEPGFWNQALSSFAQSAGKAGGEALFGGGGGGGGIKSGGLSSGGKMF